MIPRALARIDGVREAEPLARHTTIGIGGPADAYVAVTAPEQLAAVLALCRESATPVFILGSGSNIVAGDRGIRGLVVENKTQEMTGIGPFSGPPTPSSQQLSPGRSLIRVAAGASFALVSRQLAFGGLEGMEWACGIPGTIGGAVVYNAGAYGGCLADVLQRIAVWDARDGERVIEAEELGLVYRGSAFTRGLMRDRVVLWAEFALWPGDATVLRARVADYDARRLRAQPRGRNAGSFFKNPPEQPAWKLLDTAGLRGQRIGGAMFSEKHCNFLINAGDASAADVAALKGLAQRRVRETCGIELKQEVSFVGEGFGDEDGGGGA